MVNIQEAEQAAIQVCKDDPSACGIDTNGGYDEGYAAGQADCGSTVEPGSCEGTTLSADLKFHIPQATYEPFNGDSMKMWVDLEFYAKQDGMYLWKLGEYGGK